MLDFKKGFNYRYFRLSPDSISKLLVEYKKHYYDEYKNFRSKILESAFSAVDIGHITTGELWLYYPVGRDVSDLPLIVRSEKTKIVRGEECILYRLPLTGQGIKKDKVLEIRTLLRGFMQCLCFENYITFIVTGIGLRKDIKRHKFSFNSTKVKEDNSFNLVERISDETCFFICIPNEVEAPNTVDSNDFEEISYGVYYDALYGYFASSKSK